MSGRYALLILGIAAAAGTATMSRAQCRLCDVPTTERTGSAEQGVIELQIEAGIDFDRLILTGPGTGSAALRPDGSRQVGGAIGAIGGRAMVGMARVRGTPGRLVHVELPRRIALHSLSGGQIALEEVVSDLPASPRLDLNGMLTFRFGGRLEVNGDAEGEYRGEIPISVEYL